MVREVDEGRKPLKGVRSENQGVESKFLIAMSMKPS